MENPNHERIAVAPIERSIFSHYIVLLHLYDEGDVKFKVFIPRSNA